MNGKVFKISLFGDVDVNEVPEDPFWVDNGTYLSRLTNIELKQPRDEAKNPGLAFTWVIIEDDSEFNGQNLQDWKITYPNLTEDDITPDIKKDLARLKQRLVQIGVTEEDMNNWDADVALNYIGTEAYVTVRNSENADDPSKKYRNVTFVRLPE